MSEPAPDLPASPASGGAAACVLCGTPVDVAVTRCPSCGLWRAGLRQPVSRTVVLQVAGAFAVLYALTLLAVVFAR